MTGSVGGTLVSPAPLAGALGEAPLKVKLIFAQFFLLYEMSTPHVMCFSMSCHVMIWYVVLCYMACYDILCCVMISPYVKLVSKLLNLQNSKK